MTEILCVCIVSENEAKATGSKERCLSQRVLLGGKEERRTEATLRLL
jgi:hypothetical protein